MNPDPFTLRELYAMSEGRRKDAWDRTALLASILANANRDPKKRRTPFSPDDFTPFKESQPKKSGISIKSAGIGALKIFAKKKK